MFLKQTNIFVPYKIPFFFVVILISNIHLHVSIQVMDKILLSYKIFLVVGEKKVLDLCGDKTVFSILHDCSLIHNNGRIKRFCYIKLFYLTEI